jgi:hypothetical protein
MVVLVVVGLRKMSISRWASFLMIDRSKNLIWPLDSSVGFSCRQRCMEFGVLCYSVRIGVGGVLDYENVIHILRIEGYVFCFQEKFYVGLL